MKVDIPDQLKADVPQTPWGKVLNATPVVMAVVATMLAGLASSEMTRAQYDRSLGAQQQSKAGDQWGFFQAKRLRGALQRNALDLLQSTVELHPLDGATLRSAAGQLSVPGDAADGEAAKAKSELLGVLDSPVGQQAIAALRSGEVPRVVSPAGVEPKIKAATDAIEAAAPDAEITALVTQVDAAAVEKALRAAREQAIAFDAANQPTTRAIDKIESLWSRCRDLSSLAAGSALTRDYTVARMRYTAARYETEARLNQAIADLYEVQVRQSNLSAERHHNRSQRFFFGMLGAQVAVIISTFAIAARKRNLLWSLAAASGLVAIAFAIYVYLCL